MNVPPFPSQTKRDIYDIKSYTDAELFDILDLSHPTDRELEAKIHHMIWKYSNFNNDSGRKLTKFFEDIYDRFFETDEETQGNDDPPPTHPPHPTHPTQEGLETMTSAPPPTKTETKPPDERGYEYTIALDYSKDNLNPLLKQTTKRIVNIDSQYRENKNTPPTNYTFNLSTPLKDVVSLKLYSYNIPYTWYTISKSYGSNFFYLKGNSPGIDNGNYNFKIQINIGNYLVPDLISAVNRQLQNLKTDVSYTDVSFGTTGLTYNVNTTLSTFTFDIQKLYNESYYDFYFNTWSSPSGANRNLTIPAFLGFNYGTEQNPYSPTVAYSAPFTYQNGYSNSDLNNINIVLDSSNNTFTAIQYLDTNHLGIYNPSSSQVIQTYPTIIPVGNYSVYTLVQAINAQLATNPYFTSSSSFARVDVSNAAISSTYSQYQLNLRLNRFVASNIPNSKIAVQFPNDVNVWIGNSSTFKFVQPFHELSNIVSEVNSVQTNYNVPNNLKIQFTCKNPNYSDVSNNTYQAIIPASPGQGYLLNNFLNTITSSISAENTASINMSNPTGVFYMANTLAELNPATSIFNLTVDMTKNFTNYDYFLDVSNSFLLNQFGLFSDISLADVSNNIDLSTGTINSIYTFTGSVPYQSSFTYDPDTQSNLMVLKPSPTSDNRLAPKLYVNIPPGTPTTLFLNTTTASEDLTKVLNGIFNTYVDTTDTDGAQILTNSNISFTTSATALITTLNLKISKTLSQRDYAVTFEYADASLNIDLSNNWMSTSNPWYNFFGLTQETYNLADASYNQPNVSYSTIGGTKTIVDSDYITINNLNNQLTLQPQSNADTTGVYTGDQSNSIVLTVPPGQYTRDQLIAALNVQLATAATPNGQTIAAGSLFSIVPINNNYYTQLRININKIYTAADYLVDFYDPYSYTSCFNIAKSVQNTTWDSTLGWILGFHDYTEYALSNAVTGSPTATQLSGTFVNPANQIVTLVGDTAVSTYIYNSFLIILDDYNQNHMNDGLVTTTQVDTSIPLPSYANRAAARCDPTNSQSIVSTTNTTPPSTNDNTHYPQNLTKNQIYSAQEILNAQNGVSTQTVSLTNSLSSVKTNQKYYSNGPFAKDVFAIVPLKIAGQSQNTPYVDFSGTLQNQERVYFGPVNIHRMTVQLLNDRGEIVDLNNANWSFSLICEQLYQQKRT